LIKNKPLSRPRLPAIGPSGAIGAIGVFAFALALVLPRALQAQQSSDGAAVFAARCAVCHGPQAAGIPGTFPSLHEQIAAFGKTAAGRDYLIMVVSSGLMGQLQVGGVRYNNVMPAQSGLSEAEVAAVLSYLSGAEISAADVKDARSRHADNTAQNTHSLRPVSEP
jgi:mono/diheme cytochrome c family protein